MKLLAVEYDNDEAVSFFVLDGDTYKSVKSTKGGGTRIYATWPKANYRDYEHFVGVMGKFIPEVFFFSDPKEVQGMAYEDIHGVSQ